jgi:hypothetical protein
MMKATTIRGANQTPVVNALCALAGALEGHRLRTVALRSNRVRSWWRVLLGPIVTSAAMTTVLSVVFMARHGFASHTKGVARAMGAATATCNHNPSAIPATVHAHVDTTVTPRTDMSIYWLRHLTGSWIGCCTITQTLNPLVVTGTLCVELGLLTWTAPAMNPITRTQPPRLSNNLRPC